MIGIATPTASSSGFALTFIDLIFALAKPKPASQTWVGPHQVALTFDDGPSDYTSGVLGVLRQYGVPAAFFTLGYLDVQRPDLLVAERNAGMSVEDHSWDHPDLTKRTVPQIDQELNDTANAIQHATGIRPTCFRPPYGATNSTVVAEATRLGLSQILWNVDPTDYDRPGAGVIADRVLSQANGRGLVVLLHDGGGDRSQTVAALASIIQGLRSRGYSFVRLCA
jgi:peptidoglycan/xylan/chitin deacetylase (PgdA/CDA1 family)